MGMTVPGHTQETLMNYFKHGWEPGGFVTAMLAMDMERALTTADTGNRQVLWVIGSWIMNNAPAGSWGNYETVNCWIRDTDKRRTKWAVWYELNKDSNPVDYSF